METLEMQAFWNYFNHYVVWGVWAGPDSQKQIFLLACHPDVHPFFFVAVLKRFQRPPMLW